LRGSGQIEVSRNPEWHDETQTAIAMTTDSEPLWDAFISHAREDKAQVVQPLFDELRRRGYRIWYDRYELKLGDSLRGSIERGLSHSRYGIVVLSKAFLRKRWPRSELDGLLARESTDRKVILPIWHDVTEEEIAARSPILAGRLAIDSREGTSAISDAIVEVLGQPSSASASEAIASLNVAGNRADLEGLVRNVLIEGSSPAAAPVAEAKLSEILEVLRSEPASSIASQPSDMHSVEPKEASRYEMFVARGRSGNPADVDFLMSALVSDFNMGTTKLTDFALGLVPNGEGSHRVEHYLFNGTQTQRNFAALYFKRKGAIGVLRKAVEAKKIDAIQAFSK
jgi:hypothetical protein